MQQQWGRKLAGHAILASVLRRMTWEMGWKRKTTHAWTQLELEKSGLTPHPDKIAEAAALSSVALPKADYKLALPEHVLFQ